MTTASIGEHGIIGNMRSAALVNVFGAIDFFCFRNSIRPASSLHCLTQSARAAFHSTGWEALERKTDLSSGDERAHHSIHIAEFHPRVVRLDAVGGEALPHCIMRLLTPRTATSRWSCGVGQHSSMPG